MIRKIYNPGDYPKNIDVTLLLLRLVSGSFILVHGVSKFSTLFGDDPLKFAEPIGIGETESLVLTVFSEVFCALFLIVGFSTILAAIPLLLTMLVTTFIVHSNDDFGKQKLLLLYAAIFIVIALAVAGKISIDNWIYKNLK